MPLDAFEVTNLPLFGSLIDGSDLNGICLFITWTLDIPIFESISENTSAFSIFTPRSVVLPITIATLPPLLRRFSIRTRHSCISRK